MTRYFIMFFVTAGSRRQSNAYRGEMESTYSLQGSFIGPRDRDSPRPSQRRNDRTPLYLNEESRATMETPEHEINDSTTDLVEKRPLAVVRPHHLLRSIASSDEYSRYMNLDGHLRESRSLDPFPCQLRKRNEGVKFNEKNMKKKSSVSLEQGVSFISNDSNVVQNNGRPQTDNAVYVNNNCNGIISLDEANSPLLFRQTSLTTADTDDVHAALLAKKWRSCEIVGVEEESCNTSLPKGSLKSWLLNLLQGGFKSSNTSLRRVNAIQNVKDVPVFSEIQTSTQKESVV